MTTRQCADQAMVAYLRAVEQSMDNFGSALPENQGRAPHRLGISKVDEYEFGWVYFYNSREYTDTGELLYSLVGNAPVIVSRMDGELYETGTAHPVEHYIQQFIAGTRHLVPKQERKYR
jgi:Immunity protein 35